ncbi:hypothetical protein DRQ16_03690 [bacterium]|nr:MAG: hypothetical protein DRQ16_03690 [bacterium]
MYGETLRKEVFMRRLVLLLLAGAVLFGYVPQSFRNISTGTLLEDDYDFILDPGRMVWVKGGRLYTNLSNLVTTTEGLFNKTSLGTYLIGGKTTFGTLHLAGIYNRYSEENPLFTGYVDRYGNWIYGEGDIYYVHYEDRDNADGYDFMSEEHVVVSAYERYRSDDIYLGIGGLLTKTASAGLGFTMSRMRNTWFDYTLADTIRDHDLILNEDVYVYGGEGAETGEYLNNYWSVFTSLWYAMDQKTRVGVALGYRKRNIEDNYDYWWTEEEDFSPEDPEVDVERYEVVERDYDPLNTGGFYLTLRTRLGDIREPHQEIGLRLYTSGGSVDSARYYYMTGDEDRTTLGDGEEFLIDTTIVDELRNGSTGERGFSLWWKGIYVRDEKLTFGLGARFQAWSGERTDTIARSERSFEQYNDGDNEENDADDYVMTTSLFERWHERTTYAGYTITLPVGMEWRIKEYFAFRCGAVYSFTYATSTLVQQLIGKEPETRRIEYGDGTVDEDLLEDPSDVTDGVSNTEDWREPSLDYFYGFGINPLPSLQIDVMGCSNLTNLTNWRVSVTFKFH